MLLEGLFGGQQRTPPSAIPVTRMPAASFSNPVSQGLRLTWLGHASVLMEIDNMRLLIDPVFSKRASPLPIGPKRFHPAPLALDDLPHIDAVLISHDHYDHLDITVIKHLRETQTIFLVPLGVSAHLIKWDVPADRIIELDWWERQTMGPLDVVCTPARHFSGRSPFNKNTTLWASWSILGPRHRVYYGGDTGYGDHFQKIGAQLGPFDLSILKISAYDKAWPNIHTTPEEAINAHIELGGRQMLPVHWATFNLAFHAWDEPIRRAVAYASQKGVDLLTPRIGQTVDFDQPCSLDKWWETVQ